MIRLENISHVYPNGSETIEIIHDYSTTINQGLYLIVGPSGSGKTTLLNIMSGLMQPTGGRVVIDEVDYYGLKSRDQADLRAGKCGYVFQDCNLIEDFSPIDNVVLTMQNADQTYAEKRQKATELLTRVGLGERLEWKINNLSGGEKQRVAIARALANDSKYLFCDEPTGSLDPATAGEIMKLFRQLADQGYTLVMVTHNLDYIPLADEVLSIGGQSYSN